jgi:hypothetical protein
MMANGTGMHAAREARQHKCKKIQLASVKMQALKYALPAHDPVDVT